MMGGAQLSMGELQKKFGYFPENFQDIVFELRNLVLEMRPNATERVDGKGLTYFDAEIGGPVKGGICGISFASDHVQLGFIHGAFLDDPEGLLQGERDYKRIVRIYSFDDANWGAIRKLLGEQIRYVEEHHRGR